MGGVFVNYRTGDGDWAATFISRELVAKFGADNVFFASKSIRVGEDFVTRILDRLRQCDVFLAVIGSQWLTAVDRQGQRRLAKPDDWVRREIIEAFRAGLRVIPVFLDGTAPLTEADLPDDIAMLARCQYLRLHHRNDDRDIARVLDELTDILSSGEVLPPGQPGDVVAQLRQVLGAGGAGVQELVHGVTARALDAVGESRYPISMGVVGEGEVPAVLAERLGGYEHDLTELARFVATGVVVGGAAYDEDWVRVVGRMLNRARRRSSSVWVDAEAYPALLMTYVVGVAGSSVGRDEAGYKVLSGAKVEVSDTTALRALALRHVVDPRYAAEFPAWNKVRYYNPLSRHLRRALRPVFSDLLDDHEYELAFEEYEYLRSLLELHDTAFSSLGEFAFSMAKGHSALHKRMSARLGADSALLKAGAFGGSTANVTTARHQLDDSIRGRYR